MKDCTNCKGSGRETHGDTTFDCFCCGGDGKQPMFQQIQQYAWRKANRQDAPVTVADAMRRFKCDREKITKVVGFLEPKQDNGRTFWESPNPYFFIVGAPDLPSEKLEFDFEGE